MTNWGEKRKREKRKRERVREERKNQWKWEQSEREKKAKYPLNQKLESKRWVHLSPVNGIRWPYSATNAACLACHRDSQSWLCLCALLCSVYLCASFSSNALSLARSRCRSLALCTFASYTPPRKHIEPPRVYHCASLWDSLWHYTNYPFPHSPRAKVAPMVASSRTTEGDARIVCEQAHTIGALGDRLVSLSAPLWLPNGRQDSRQPFTQSVTESASQTMAWMEN